MLGINRMKALLLSVLLCFAVLKFPYALHSGLTFWWILSVFILIISGTLGSRIKLNRKRKNSKELLYPQEIPDDDSLAREEIMTAETVSKEILAEKTVAEKEVITENSIVIEKDVVEPDIIVNNKPSVSEGFVDLEISLTVDELIDFGFNEKQAGNFHQAADYFLRALSLNPIPDLALCLIMDCYWLLNSIGECEYALTELKLPVRTYLSQFNPELRHRFDAWVSKENLKEQIF